MDVINQLFDPVKKVRNSVGMDYEKVDQIISTAIAFTKVSNQSAYIIDYYQQSFAFVSHHPLFLCGYSTEQVKEWGYGFYERVVPRQDLTMLLEINQKGFDFFYNLPVERRTQGYISYDFIVKHPQKQTLINHKLTPIYLTNDGNIWLALCLINLSTNQESGNVIIQMLDEPQRYVYSFKSKRFYPSGMIRLSDREIQILEFSARGFSAQEIASEAFIDINTVKYHKRNIYRKLGVTNISEAIYYASSNNLI